MAGPQVSSVGGLLSSCVGHGYSSIVAVCMGALLQMWCAGSSLVVVGDSSLVAMESQLSSCLGGHLSKFGSEISFLVALY